MSVALYYVYHETDETREAREGYNVSSTGERGAVEDPANRVELPTPAGSLLLDISEMTEKATPGGGSSSSSINRIKSTKPTGRPGERVSGGDLQRNKGKQGQLSFAKKQGKHQRPSGEEGSPSADADKRPQVTFGGGEQATAEDDVPPLTAEDAKARATRTAMLIEYNNRHEYSKGRGSESQYDTVLSA